MMLRLHPTWGLHRIDLLLWVLAIFAVLALHLAFDFAPELQEDSFQYLSIAANVRAGEIGETSLIQFDAERAFGRVPAPVVTFPVGYPIAIAVVTLAGLSLPQAALLISILSTVACVPILTWLAARMRFPRILANAVVGAFVVNGAAASFGTAAMSEALFTALVLVAIALLVAGRNGTAPRALWISAFAGVAFGAAYLVRYAGLFFVIGVAILVTRDVLARDWKLARKQASALLAAGLVIGVGIARNILLAGDWRGGNAKAVSNDISTVVNHLRQALSGVFVGSVPGPSLARDACLALFALAVLWLALMRIHRRNKQSSTWSASGVAADLAILASTYAAGMFYAGLTSVVSLGPRMFVPLTPILLLLIGEAIRLLWGSNHDLGPGRRVGALLLGATLCLYVFLNVQVLRLAAVDGSVPVAAQMDVASSGGDSARTVVAQYAGADGVIVANDGQAVGYVLGLPTVALVGPHYSDTEWTEQAVAAVVRRFGAKALVILVPAQGAVANNDIMPSAFIDRLAHGDAPSWLVQVYRSPGVLIYLPRQ